MRLGIKVAPPSLNGYNVDFDTRLSEDGVLSIDCFVGRQKRRRSASRRASRGAGRAALRLLELYGAPDRPARSHQESAGKPCRRPLSMSLSLIVRSPRRVRSCSLSADLRAEAVLAKDEILARALRAANRVAHRGAGAPEAVVLYRSRRICLLLPELATVARMVPADEANVATEARELAVSRYLAERGAPVVGPAATMPAAPFIEEGMVVTLWPHIAHAEAHYDSPQDVADAAYALRRVHDALADYPGALPSYAERIEECAALLRKPGALPALADDDRTFLMRAYERLSHSLAAFAIRSLPIHGDAHLGNVFVTPGGPLWTDFETVCLGPREWDAAGVPHLPAFQPLDAQLYAVLSGMRSLCVVVWCSVLAGDP